MFQLQGWISEHEFGYKKLGEIGLFDKIYLIFRKNFLSKESKILLVKLFFLTESLLLRKDEKSE